MVTVATLRLPRVTSVGSEFGSIVNLNSSLASNMLSSFIGTLNETLVTPAENMTVYGPES